MYFIVENKNIRDFTILAISANEISAEDAFDTSQIYSNDDNSKDIELYNSDKLFNSILSQPGSILRTHENVREF